MRAVSLAGLLLAGCATTTDPTLALRADSDDAYAIAASLVMEVGPRFAGTPGDAKAVQWGVRTMQELGFTNVRLEPVTVPRWVRGEISVELRAPRAMALEAVALGGSAATPDRGVEAPVVGVATVEALEALPDSAVKGRIVFINTRMTRERDGAGYGKAVPARRKGAAVAGRKGAVAVLIRSIGTDLHAHTGTTKYDEGQPKVPAAALSQPSADALEQALAAGATRVRILLSTDEMSPAPSANVVAEIPGKSNEIILLGAHLDSWDITPGANDDAAGIGIVLAAAKRVEALGTPEKTIRVVLFANEEFGASGAKAYAKAHAAEVSLHVLVMEADSGSGVPWRLHGGVADADWPWVAERATALGLVVGENGKDGGTDVEPMRKLGVPEIEVTQDGSKYFDVHHTAADSVSTLDRAGMSQAAGVFATLVHAVGQREVPLGRIPPKP